MNSNQVYTTYKLTLCHTLPEVEVIGKYSGSLTIFLNMSTNNQGFG